MCERVSQEQKRHQREQYSRVASTSSLLLSSWTSPKKKKKVCPSAKWLPAEGTITSDGVSNWRSSRLIHSSSNDDGEWKYPFSLESSGKQLRDSFHSFGSNKPCNSSPGDEIEAWPPRHICAVVHANQRRSHAQDMYNYRGHYSTYAQRWAEHQGEHVDSNCSRVESTSRWLTVARTLCPVIDDDGLSVLPRSGATHTHTHTLLTPTPAGWI